MFPISNWTELDIWQYIHLERHRDRAALFRGAAPDRRARRSAAHGRRSSALRVSAGRGSVERSMRFRTLGCYPADRRGGERGDDAARGDPGDAAHHHQRAAGPGDRQGRRRRMEKRRSRRAISDDRRPFASSLDRCAHRRGYRRLSEQHQNKSLLRFITCGSVDDGKSTLIGRLLYDSKMIFEDQLGDARGGFASASARRGGDRLRAARRRPCRRARAGHHHRRRLPLLRDRQAQVHRRRHARARAIYAQHGDRRLDRRSRRDPDRCAQGRADADAAAQLSRAPDRHPQHRAGGQQDGPDRLRSGDVRRDRRGLSAFATNIGIDDFTPSRSRGSRATTSPRERRTRPGMRGRR